jgi:hypothetical protein
MPRNPDRTDLCHFTYADGRRCTLPQFPDDYGLCYHHREKRQAFLEAREAGRQISRFLETDILTACDLSCTLSALFSATAMGYIKPKTAATLGYLAQLMLQAQERAKAEFLQSGGKSWSKIVRKAPAFQPDEPDSDEPDSDEPDSTDPAQAEPDSNQADHRSVPNSPAPAEPETPSGDAETLPLVDRTADDPDSRTAPRPRVPSEIELTDVQVDALPFITTPRAMPTGNPI